MAGIDLVHVPYKGGGQALNDLLGGQIQLMFNPPVSLMQHGAKGKVRLLAITSSKRVEGIDLPTMSESGVPGFESSVWFGLFVPTGTPEPVIRKLNGELNRILGTSDVIERFHAAGLVRGRRNAGGARRLLSRRHDAMGQGRQGFRRKAGLKEPTVAAPAIRTARRAPSSPDRVPRLRPPGRPVRDRGPHQRPQVARRSRPIGAKSALAGRRAPARHVGPSRRR